MTGPNISPPPHQKKLLIFKTLTVNPLLYIKTMREVSPQG